MNLLNLLVLAMVGEALWETLKMAWQNGKVSIDRIGAMVVGILLSLGTGVDMMELLNIPIKIKFVGLILTGLLISRGANFVHDILSSISNIQSNTKSNSNSK